jgi:small subunit ribosomal protein S21
MLIVAVKDGESIDRALKKYKRKYDKTRVVRQLRARQAFIKPSVSKRQRVLKASHKQRLISKEDI